MILLKKDSNIGVFLVNIAKFFLNTYPEEHKRTAASKKILN